MDKKIVDFLFLKRFLPLPSSPFVVNCFMLLIFDFKEEAIIYKTA